MPIGRPVLTVYSLRFALRSLSRSRGFTATAVLILTLGIGVNTAFFSIVDQVLLRPLVFPDVDRLVCLVERTDQTLHDAANYEAFLEWRERQHSFTVLGAARAWNGYVAGPGDPEQLEGAQVSFDYLLAAAVRPLRGRLFTAADDQPKAERTVLISEALWARMFNSSDAALGAPLTIRGMAYTIIGVMPRGFIQPTVNCAFWVPVAPFDHDYRNHVPRMPAPFTVLGRLKPGIDVSAARRDLEAIARQLELAQPNLNQGRSVALLPLTDRMFGATRTTLFVLLAASGGVLLIACANLCGLLLVRTLARQREFSVRVALGAGRGRIAGLVFAEGLLLGLIGCGGGWLLALWSVHGARSWLPAQFPRADALSLDHRAVGCAVVAGLLAALCAGGVAVWQLTRAEACGALTGRTRATGGRHSARWQSALVVVQLTVTLVLLVATGLMVRTLARLHQADLGFVPAQVVSFSWSPPLQEARRNEWTARALERVAALPGVSHVGFISEMPLGGNYFIRPISIEGFVPAATAGQPESSSFIVSPDYFAATGMRLLRGRSFTARDSDANAPAVVVIDTLLATRYFPDQDPLGRRIKFGRPNDRARWIEIIGIVAHVENRGVGRSGAAQAYIPHTQSGPPPNMAFMVRARGQADALVPTIRQVMRELAPAAPIYAIASMEQRFDSIIAPQRLAGWLLGMFAVLGLVLGAVGLFGLLSFQVQQRTREFGIRIALGAQRRDVLWMVFRQCLQLVGTGIACGLATAAAGSRLIASLLYATAPGDLPTFIGAPMLLLVVAVLASGWPALQATRVNPVEALCAE